MINYAHRGASAYAPENTMPAFVLGDNMGANGVETDIQKTRDDVLVLFHDRDLMRICGRPEAICELTFRELRMLDFGSHKGPKYAGTPIPTLAEFLDFFANKKTQMALEIKQPGVEADLIRMVHSYHVEARTVITSTIWESLLCVHALDDTLRLGFLTDVLSDELMDEAEHSGIPQICPRAAVLTEPWNQKLRERGFSVRAWDVDDEKIMRRMIDLKVDGMTVNFPDRLKMALDQDAK
ncbi:MAG: hypothetical protein IJ240_09160 [Clostridia bacterium]|nr:hypothetical protein [Clostridia bacterium]